MVNMARTVAGERVLTTGMLFSLNVLITNKLKFLTLKLAETLTRSELVGIVVTLIDNEYLSMEEITEGLNAIGEIRSITNKTIEAVWNLPRYKLREFVAELLQSSRNYQKWLVLNWPKISHGVDLEKYEGDPYEGDPHALVAFMDHYSSANLRVMIGIMAQESMPIRDWLKERLLITKEDGSLKILEFKPNPEV
ncbi:hypothetical protein NHQ30_008758 [Ciborinia camelliae]|nr:hypothetical protein NHQ30_008758 [Ciborinia camelliae]